jgi:hypothetical protein
VFFIGREDGALDAWDLLDSYACGWCLSVGSPSLRSCAPVMTQNVSAPESITVLQACDNPAGLPVFVM